MEVEVRRVVSNQVGFVALPLNLIYALQKSSILPPLLVLELSLIHHRPGSSLVPWFVAWIGDSSKSPCIEVPEVLANCLGLPDGVKVNVRARIDVPEAESVQVEPASADDCEVLELNAAYLEEHVLTKVGVVQAGCRFPVSVPGQGTICLLAKSTSPASVVKLVRGTEIHISLKKRPLKSNAAVEVPDIWLRVQGCDNTRNQVYNWDGRNVTVVPTTSVWISATTAHRVGLENGQLVLLRHRIVVYDDKQTSKKQAALADEEISVKRTATVRVIYWDGVSEGHLMVSEPLRRFIGVHVHAGIYALPIYDSQVWRPTVIRVHPVLPEVQRHDTMNEQATGDANQLPKFVRIWIDNELKASSGAHDEVPLATNAIVSILDGQEFNFVLNLENTIKEEVKPSYFLINTGMLDAGLQKKLSVELQLGRSQHLQLLPKDNARGMKLPSLESVWPKGVAVEALSRLKVLLSPVTRKKLRDMELPLPGGVLVHGPHACGKTQLALALARAVNEDRRILAHRVFLKCAELTGEPDTTPKRILKEAALEAIEHAPCLVILDDVDALVPTAEGRESTVTSLAEYLSDLIDDAQGSAPVAFLATATDPKALPFAGRFDCVVELEQPKASERAEILKAALRNRKLEFSDNSVSEISKKCEGYDANDLEILVDRALHAASSRLLVNKRNKAGNLALLPDDFDSAIEGYTPSALKGVAKSAKELKLGWDDIGGLPDVCRVLQELLELPVKFPQLFANAPLRLRTGVLLYGPPGCGKTHTVAAAAAACALRFVPVKGPELLDKYIGASEKAVRDIFVKAAAAAPCILFFDEFDAIAPKRGHDNTGVTDRVVNQLLAELDGVSALNGVFVFAATNRPDLIDAALLRPGRLDHLLFCNYPSTRERLDILRVLSRHLPMAKDIDLEYVAHHSEGFSGADIKAVLSDAELEAVHFAIERSEPPVITWNMLKASLGKTVPLQEAERRRFASIYSSFTGSRSSSKDVKGKKATLA